MNIIVKIKNLLTPMAKSLILRFKRADKQSALNNPFNSVALGKRIQEVRLSKFSISQIYMGNEIGLTRLIVRDIENGYRLPTFLILKKISRFLNINILWLLGIEASKEKTNYIFSFYYAKKIYKKFSIPTRIYINNVLNPVELFVLESLSEGKSIQEISKTLSVSYRMIQYHIKHIRVKINCPYKTVPELKGFIKEYCYSREL